VSRVPVWTAALALAGATLGCNGQSLYPPRVVARHELVLRYDNRFELWGEGRPVATAYRFEGLTDYVGCVPAARAHAQDAEADGRAVGPLMVSGGVLAGVGLGGLGGLAFLNKNNAAMGAVFGVGIGVELTALVLVLVGRGNELSASGHAVDAMNYYNDAVGRTGQGCRR